MRCCCANILMLTRAYGTHNNISISQRSLRFSPDVVRFFDEKGGEASRNRDKVHTNWTPLYSIFTFHLFQLNVIRRMPFTFVPIEFQHFWFRCVDAELAFTVHCALFRGFATMHSTGIGKLNVNFCMNPICSIAALFESGNYNTLPRIQPHIFFSFIASTAIASNITKSTSLPSYAYEFATACRYLFILFLLLVCRVPTKHIRIQNERIYSVRNRIWENREMNAITVLCGHAVYLHSFHLLKMRHDGHLRTENKLQTSRYSYSKPWYIHWSGFLCSWHRPTGRSDSHLL